MFGKWRAIVRQVRLVTDEQQLSVESTTPQLSGRCKARYRSADDGNRAHRHGALTCATPSMISTSYVRTGFLAGGESGRPVRTSNRDSCNGHSTQYPSSHPSANEAFS